jgi:hypothetical protein
VKITEKISKLWIVNVMSFLLFSLLGVTGLIICFYFLEDMVKVRVSWLHLDISW